MNTRKKVRDIRHKHFELDQNKLDQVRNFLGAATERETIEKLLDRAIAEDAIDQVHRDMAGIGGMEDFFGINSMGIPPIVAKKKLSSGKPRPKSQTRR